MLYEFKTYQNFDVSYYNYGWRQLDPQLGIWHSVDKLAEMYPSISPYAYANNNPISNIDIAGLTFESALQDLWESPFGGTWTSGGGTTFFGSNEEAYNWGVANGLGDGVDREFGGGSGGGNGRIAGAIGRAISNSRILSNIWGSFANLTFNHRLNKFDRKVDKLVESGISIEEAIENVRDKYGNKRWMYSSQYIKDEGLYGWRAVSIADYYAEQNGIFTNDNQNLGTIALGLYSDQFTGSGYTVDNYELSAPNSSTGVSVTITNLAKDVSAPNNFDIAFDGVYAAIGASIPINGGFITYGIPNNSRFISIEYLMSDGSQFASKYIVELNYMQTLAVQKPFYYVPVWFSSPNIRNYFGGN